MEILCLDLLSPIHFSQKVRICVVYRPPKLKNTPELIEQLEFLDELVSQNQDTILLVTTQLLQTFEDFSTAIEQNQWVDVIYLCYDYRFSKAAVGGRRHGELRLELILVSPHLSKARQHRLSSTRPDFTPVSAIRPDFAPVSPTRPDFAPVSAIRPDFAPVSPPQLNSPGFHSDQRHHLALNSPGFHSGIASPSDFILILD
ncbi:hypothetical protein DdX_13417 [Ditylenchus destructor]|uniref:Uncharacterized protein n=1 Tax=Ditylenchus destructor TaxID=166010 RepID=A0AAD4MYS6_9BILA|nr:hypothetical protein DdX_13417 [Ditylenchus destructor]